MQTATRPLTSLWATVRTQLRESRDAHTARAMLERELASYDSQSDLDDLHAILDRYSEQETRDIRRILAVQHNR
jgi:hypothetical protein